MNIVKRLNLIIVVLFGMYQGTSHAATIDVDIVSFTFSPAEVNIQVGDTVRWTNRDSVAHTTTSGESGEPDGVWNSGNLGLNESFSFVFDTAGSFPYFCIPHIFMTGIVNVAEVPVATISPPSGDYVSSQNFDVSLIVTSSSAVVVGATVIFDGVDRTALFQGCSIGGILNGGGQSFRCPNIITGLTEGAHTLDITVNMSDGSTISDSVIWQVQGTIE